MYCNFNFNFNLNRRQILVVSSLMFLGMIAAAQVHAGTGGDEFKDLYDQLRGMWSYSEYSGRAFQ